jgi:RNA polymerase-interacting CarD/CdnL/TRCF family regulator
LQQRAIALDAKRVSADEVQSFEAERARAAALAPDAPERGEIESTARAHLETAIARAETRQLESQRLDVERALIKREAELQRVLAARIAADQSAGLARARAIANAEVARALARLDQRPAQRPKLTREELTLLAKALLMRAELIAFALDTADAAPLDEELRAALAQAKAARNPDEALSRADAAHTLVLVALANLRKARGPSAEESGSLADALSGVGLSTTRTELGLTAELGAQPDVARTLPTVCRIARAFPHGNLVLFSPGKPDAATHLAQWQAAGCDAARLRVEPVGGHAQHSLVFPAY